MPEETRDFDALPHSPFLPHSDGVVYFPMPRTTRTVRVAEIPGETMRWRVESWSSPQKPHTVDLLAYAGAGECSCTDWSTRRGPAIKQGGIPGTPATACRHVMAARLSFLNRLLRDMAQRHAQPDAKR